MEPQNRVVTLGMANSRDPNSTSVTISTGLLFFIREAICHLCLLFIRKDSCKLYHSNFSYQFIFLYSSQSLWSYRLNPLNLNGPYTVWLYLVRDLHRSPVYSDLVKISRRRSRSTTQMRVTSVSRKQEL